MAKNYILGAIAGDIIGASDEFNIADFVQVILGPDLMKDAVIPFSGKYGGR